MYYQHSCCDVPKHGCIAFLFSTTPNNAPIRMQFDPKLCNRKSKFIRTDDVYAQNWILNNLSRKKNPSKYSNPEQGHDSTFVATHI